MIVEMKKRKMGIWNENERNANIYEKMLKMMKNEKNKKKKEELIIKTSGFLKRIGYRRYATSYWYLDD